MLKILHIYFLLTLGIVNSFGQVGINTSTPSAALDVVGDVKVEGSLFLENPGEHFVIPDSKLLIQTTDNRILEYNINNSKYGPINYARFVFRKTSTHGLQDYDTKISTSKYLVTVQGYYFLGDNANTNVLLHSNSSDNNIEGYQIYAYPNPSTGTWFIRAFVNNSTFRNTTGGGGFQDRTIDLFLNLIIYRQGFISKQIDDIVVDMSNSESGTAPIPAGF